MALNKVNYVDGETVITAENLNDIQDAIIALENAPAQGLTEDMKQALLQIARKVAYIDDQGQTYYDDLYDALYPPKTVVLITAVFEQGSTVIYDDTALDDLKQYLTVTAKYDDNTTTILPDASYTLSGMLEAGMSTVTVAYNSLTTTFTVNVTARPTLSSISAVYTQSGTVYDTDTLDSLKADLVVTAHYSDSSTQTVPAADYTLSGELTVGTSTITVSYGGKTATFDVTVTAYWTWEYNPAVDGLLSAQSYVQAGSSSNYTENISDGLLHLVVPQTTSAQNSYQMRLSDGDGNFNVSTGEMLYKVKFNSVAYSDGAQNAFRTNFSQGGTRGAKVFFYKDNSGYHFAMVHNNIIDNLITVYLDTWYEVRIKIEENNYSISVNGTTVYSGATWETNVITYCGLYVISNKRTSSESKENTDAYIEYIKFRSGGVS